MTPNFDGKLVIFSAPSGSGKTTIVQHLLERGMNLEFSISATTRLKRPHEIDGKDYHFLTVQEFNNEIDAGEFIEWEEVYPDQYYGTLKSEIQRIWGHGHHVIFDIDVEGGKNLKSQFGEKALSIFVKAPNLEVLKQRLESRGTENEESMKKRLGKAEKEYKQAPHFDLVLVNDELDRAVQEAFDRITEFLES